MSFAKKGENIPEKVYKITLVGGPGVGKSSLSLLWKDGCFPPDQLIPGALNGMVKTRMNEVRMDEVRKNERMYDYVEVVSDKFKNKNKKRKTRMNDNNEMVIKDR